MALLLCEPAMHSEEAVSRAAEAACEQGHSRVRPFGGAAAECSSGAAAISS